MVSLDQYLENKKKRTEALSGSAKKACADQTSSALKKLKALTEGSPTIKRVCCPLVLKISSLINSGFFCGC